MGSITTPPLRIAILECDTPLDNTRAKFGGYGGVFKALLEAGADALDAPGLSSKEGLDLSYFHVQRDQVYPSLEDIDAILITGSRYDAWSNDPWVVKLVDFVGQVLNQNRVRVIGVCFGHQIVARALGVEVGRNDLGWEVAVMDVQLTDKGKELFKKDSLKIQQMHRDIVYTYPKGVEPLGHSPRCDVQSMYAKGRLITVQGHPEFTGTIVREVVESRHKMGIFDDSLYKDALARVDNQHDGVAIAQAFLRFLLEN